MFKIKEKIQYFETVQSIEQGVYKPSFYRISKDEEKQLFAALFDKPGLIVNDTILDQLKELIKIKNPAKKFNEQELENFARKHVEPSSLEEYGVWVYYPWSNRLVHICDEEEFIEIRTSRNQYKITKEERDLLHTKRIGVIGLSVGQSVSITLAMERICGELRLADFDILELNNMNRIRTGIHNIGLPKVYAVAREIAEIDPFLSVKCFEAGVTESNMDAFFMDGGKLDLMVEESDGFDIKILSRYKARELRIPVIMEASDRCMVDVERFDLEPGRSILHGLVDHLDLNTLKNLKTTEEKIPYMLDILGLETSSLKLKASMLEIDQTINTWPQLASAVAMGGGITADVSRRLLLNQFTQSGRYHLDVEEHIGNNKSSLPENKNPAQHHQPKDFKLIANNISIPVVENQLELSESEIEKIVLAGCLAPSGGNSQPWRWIYKENTLLLFMAFDGNHTMLGFNNYASYVALGAASENVILQADEMGYESQVEVFPFTDNPDLVASFRFFKKTNSGNKNILTKGIDIRLTNRKLGARTTIEPQLLNDLIEIAQETEGVKLQFFKDDEELNNIAEVLGEIEKVRLLEKTGHRDFVNEIRWTEKETEETRDGIDIRTVDLSNTELIGLQVAKSNEIIDLIKKWNGGGAFKKLTKKSIDAAGAVGFITMPEQNAISFFNSGRALQRTWLSANLKGVSFQPMASSVFIYARTLIGKGKDLSLEGCLKLMNLRPAFEKVLNLTSEFKDMFIFRLSMADQPEIKSLRKPLNDVYSYIKK